MPLFVEVIAIIVMMIVGFFVAFLMMFLLALFLFPIERSLSRMIWDLTTPKRPPAQQSSFKDFSKKHN
ncbi:MAG: hypothetical protein HYV06_10235 [Deltaproteobacteria bacterium]|nr:hypothetical protein [Deltaproteobacteria bacterium]